LKTLRKEKLNKKIFSTSENEKYPTAQPDTTKTDETQQLRSFADMVERRAAYNSTYEKLPVQCFG